MSSLKSLLCYISASICVFLLPSLVTAKSVGKVDFNISCTAESQKAFNDALAQVHNMMYQQAEMEFEKIIKSDPDCGMAYWGIALTQVHPLWADLPNEAEMKKGSEALNKALEKKLTEREKDFVLALQTFFTDWESIQYRKRIQNWAMAQHNIYGKYPDDPDALSFHALMLLATAPKADKTFHNQKIAGTLLEGMHKKHPMHPAAFHYTIHAYDNPMLAKKGEYYARGYDKIAPEVPHALHMPSHIFVRLGYWPETIDWNIRSANVAKSQPIANGAMSMHYAHALDYLMYAYLQQEQDKKATEVLNQLNAVAQFEDSFPTAYGIAAARARFYLEQQLWNQAANSNLKLPNTYPWDKHPAAKSIVIYAQGFAAIKSGKFDQAKQSIKDLSQIYTQLMSKNQNYWAVLVDSKRKTLEAWIEYTNGNKESALKKMKASADLEDSVDKHPVTPGEVLPAREAYAHMLLFEEKYSDALTAYETVLEISPNRFYSIYGVGFAAEKLGDRAKATKYYRQLLEQTKLGDSKRPEVLHAKEFFTTGACHNLLAKTAPFDAKMQYMLDAIC